MNASITYYYRVWVACAGTGFKSFGRDQQKFVKLDLNRMFVKSPLSSELCRVRWESMKEAGIHPDDIVLIDRMKKYKPKSVVLVNIDGLIALKYYGVDEKWNEYFYWAWWNSKELRIYPEEEATVLWVVVWSFRMYE